MKLLSVNTPATGTPIDCAEDPPSSLRSRLAVAAPETGPPPHRLAVTVNVGVVETAAVVFEPKAESPLEMQRELRGLGVTGPAKSRLLLSVSSAPQLPRRIAVVLDGAGALFAVVPAGLHGGPPASRALADPKPTKSISVAPEGAVGQGPPVATAVPPWYRAIFASVADAANDEEFEVVSPTGSGEPTVVLGTPHLTR